MALPGSRIVELEYILEFVDEGGLSLRSTSPCILPPPSIILSFCQESRTEALKHYSILFPGKPMWFVNLTPDILLLSRAILWWSSFDQHHIWAPGVFSTIEHICFARHNLGSAYWFLNRRCWCEGFPALKAMTIGVGDPSWERIGWSSTSQLSHLKNSRLPMRSWQSTRHLLKELRRVSCQAQS